MSDQSDYSKQFKALQQSYLDSLDDTCEFFESSLSFMQTGCLDHSTLMTMKLEANNLLGSGKSYGFACVSDAADLMLSMLKHLNEQYGEDIALPVHQGRPLRGDF